MPENFTQLEVQGYQSFKNLVCLELNASDLHITIAEKLEASVKDE